MATLTVRIKMDNEAFSEDRESEAGRILGALSDRLTMSRGGFLALASGVKGRLLDTNGNTCGDYAVTEE